MAVLPRVDFRAVFAALESVEEAAGVDFLRLTAIAEDKSNEAIDVPSYID